MDKRRDWVKLLNEIGIAVYVGEEHKTVYVEGRERYEFKSTFVELQGRLNDKFVSKRIYGSSVKAASIALLALIEESAK